MRDQARHHAPTRQQQPGMPYEPAPVLLRPLQQGIHKKVINELLRPRTWKAPDDRCGQVSGCPFVHACVPACISCCGAPQHFSISVSTQCVMACVTVCVNVCCYGFLRPTAQPQLILQGWCCAHVELNSCQTHTTGASSCPHRTSATCAMRASASSRTSAPCWSCTVSRGGDCGCALWVHAGGAGSPLRGVMCKPPCTMHHTVHTQR